MADEDVVAYALYKAIESATDGRYDCLYLRGDWREEITVDGRLGDM